MRDPVRIWEDTARWSIRADSLFEQTIVRATGRSLQLVGEKYPGRPRVEARRFQNCAPSVKIVGQASMRAE
jgi:hypothetical protein